MLMLTMFVSVGYIRFMSQYEWHRQVCCKPQQCGTPTVLPHYSCFFQDLLRSCPEEMHRVLTDLAVVLVQNAKEWPTPEPLLCERTGRIGYKEKMDEVNYDKSYPNKTVFAYLNFEKEGKLTTEQVSKHIGIDLFCGRFSFAELPNSYRCILGVTGTLNELRSIAGFDRMLQEEYGFKHFTVTPSIFGKGRLTFNPADHLQALSLK